MKLCRRRSYSQTCTSPLPTFKATTTSVWGWTLLTFFQLKRVLLLCWTMTQGRVFVKSGGGQCNISVFFVIARDSRFPRLTSGKLEQLRNIPVEFAVKKAKSWCMCMSLKKYIKKLGRLLCVREFNDLKVLHFVCSLLNYFHVDGSADSNSGFFSTCNDFNQLVDMKKLVYTQSIVTFSFWPMLLGNIWKGQYVLYS